MLKDKYNLTKEQNIFLAKKEIVETIYNAIRLEGCNTTYLQTEKIFNGINDGAVALDDIRTILNLKSAWNYMLTNIDKKLDIAFICNINQRVARDESLDWGVIRYGDVGVRLADGSSFQPEIPDAEYVEKKLNEIDKMDNITEKALTYYLWGLRSQLFWDGNKRTSNIIANAILIKNGKGIITIHEKNIDEFNIILSEFYLSNNGDTLKEFLYEKCIKGMTIDKELEKKNKNACIAVNGMNNENKK